MKIKPERHESTSTLVNEDSVEGGNRGKVEKVRNKHARRRKVKKNEESGQ
jgi:hypothetical protein